eukprot:TRINITY_DN102232_c0_g1_i1.p1 TRINITY_DN102232_c0_g1~~TRINITY_DN102232_c0_g1_i1.p1  ORF type:complete len:206 (+),score=19.66 TRINITY_DN102232_c0_g1_i1:63-680(+)
MASPGSIRKAPCGSSTYALSYSFHDQSPEARSYAPHKRFGRVVTDVTIEGTCYSKINSCIAYSQQRFLETPKKKEQRFPYLRPALNWPAQSAEAQEGVAEDAETALGQASSVSSFADFMGWTSLKRSVTGAEQTSSTCAPGDLTRCASAPSTLFVKRRPAKVLTERADPAPRRFFEARFPCDSAPFREGGPGRPGRRCDYTQKQR